AAVCGRPDADATVDHVGRQYSRTSSRRALFAALIASRRRAIVASASGIAITTASRYLQNSGSLLALRRSARNGRILANVETISPCAARNASASMAPVETSDAAMSQ